MHFALLIAASDLILPEHLKFTGDSFNPRSAPNPNDQNPWSIIEQQLATLLKQPAEDLFQSLEALIVHTAYRHSRYNQVRSAELLGVTRNVLRTLLKRHGLLTDQQLA